ncbi:BatD family protein [Tamlana sp. 2_MG-2023]|uniref:BatD family protein n=1 Tax=unclassified Tamlana TaxID=2614803 RepID=UPI0026E28573|nr:MULTISPECIES: BatD family protein [unclassified Tamlana]MDO6759937.1 BatD family protein [Tamlana sp. 2_MG-2023]MDO6791893.1 BatD family protein [Tamlana sp. 1_MG-2023]
MQFIKNIYILLIVFSASIASGQSVEFVMKTSKQKLGINERLRVDFEMNQDGDNFTPPDFSNFTVVGGPNQSVSNSWINGKRTYKKTYSYFLAPKKRGTFTISQASIVIEGNTYKTTPKSIEVTAAVEIPKDPNDPSYVASEGVHLVAEVSKANPYLNEAITVVYKLYISPTIGVDQMSEIDSPRYNDFWSQIINTQNEKVQNGKYKGEDYRFLVYKKAVLYPQKTGELEIEPLSLDLALRVPTNRRDIFGSTLMSRANRTISAGRKTINVKALPEAGKPVDFTGAVGSFDFDVTTSKTELDATESLQLNISVKGNGNLKLFKLPKVTLPSSLEVYEPEHDENVKTNLSGMQGRITDSYTIVPQYKGKYPIPSISFSYFDIKSKSYKRLSSEEILINVLNGPASHSANTDNTNASAVNKQEVVSNTDHFAFIKTQTDFTSIKQSYFFKTNLFWSLLLLPFLAIPLAIVVRNKKADRDADVSGNKVRKANKLVKKYLGHAKKSLGQKEAFYIALEKALHNYLKAKLHIETSDMSKEKITNLLEGKQVDQAVITDFISLIERCELARYTPIDIATMQEDFEKAGTTISLIDKQAR